MKRKKMKHNETVGCLMGLRDDIKELEWEKLSDDKISVLISKPAVLKLVQDWIEYSLEEAK